MVKELLGVEASLRDTEGAEEICSSVFQRISQCVQRGQQHRKIWNDAGELISEDSEIFVEVFPGREVECLIGFLRGRKTVRNDLIIEYLQSNDRHSRSKLPKSYLRFQFLFFSTPRNIQIYQPSGYA
jgi:hypothetical protein